MEKIGPWEANGESLSFSQSSATYERKCLLDGNHLVNNSLQNVIPV